MNKISVKEIVEFPKLSQKKTENFLQKVKLPKVPKLKDSSGGNYWVRSVSGVSKAFKKNNSTPIKQKIEEILVKYDITKREQSKIMYQRNLNVLHNYENFDFSIWYPVPDIKFPKRKNSVIVIDGISIQVLPNQIFTYEIDKKEKIGAISFVIKLDGFIDSELGVFSEATFRYLSEKYIGYEVDPKYCIVVNIADMQSVNYHQILNDEISSLLKSIVKKISTGLS